MAKKKNIPVIVEAPACGGQLAARDISQEAQIASLKNLNNFLVKGTVESREQIHQLRSEIASLAADHEILDDTERDLVRLVLCSSLSDAAARSAAEMAATTETVEKMLKKAESVTAELNAVELRLLVVAREKDGFERDLLRVVTERDSSRSDLYKKRKELVDLEGSIQSLEQALTQMLKDKEVADAKCRKLEEEGKRSHEELRSVIHEKNLLERYREDEKRFAEKLVREMELMKSQKGVDKDILNAENKANASKIEALEEECRVLKEIRGRLENEACNFKVSLELMLKDKEVAEAKCRKLEEEGSRRQEELRSGIHEKNLLERHREDEKRFVEELVREMEVMKIQKDVDMDILNAENKANASNIEALEEECLVLKEIKGQLENEVSNLKVSLELMEQEVELAASYADSEKRYVRIEEDLKKNLIEYGRLEKEKLELEKTFDVKEKEMTLQINELKGNMTEMAADKNLVDQRNAKYEIQIRNLQTEILKFQSARKCLEDDHRSSSEKTAIKEIYSAAMQRETDLKAEEAVALQMQLNESIKAKHIMEITIEALQIELNHRTAENEETRKHIDSLMVEKASLEKQLKTSNQGFQDIEKKLKTLEDASGKVFALLKKITTEVMDEERTQENCISKETGVEVENGEEMKLFVDNLEAIKLAVKGKETKIKDLNQKLELLQLSVSFAKNKGAIWKWLFPATTTIFAAVSLAYAARAR